MSTKLLYNVHDTYDADKIVMEDAKYREVMDFAGLSHATDLSAYAKRGGLILSRYRVEISGKYNPRAMCDADRERFKALFGTVANSKEWERVCADIRQAGCDLSRIVIAKQKNGGKKLKIREEQIKCVDLKAESY